MKPIHQNIKGGLIALFLMIATVFVISLYHREVDIDDAWLGEQAYWFAKLGYVKSELFRGFAGYEEKLVVYHKLLILQGGGLIRLFGWNPYILKALSGGYLCVLLLAMARLFKRHVDNWRVAYLAYVTLYLFSPFVFQAAFRFRPEIMLGAFGVLSYIALDNYLGTGRRGAAVGAGVLAGLACCTHLNGVIYVWAGLILLLLTKRLRAWLLFIGGATVGMLPYGYDLTSRADLARWWLQFRNDPAFQGEEFHVFSYGVKLLKEINRFLHSPKEQCLTFLLLIVGFWSLRYWNRRYSHVLVYTVGLIFGLGLVAHNKTTKYMLAYLPFVYFLLITGLQHIYTGAQRPPSMVRRRLTSVALGIYLTVNSVLIAILMAQNWDMVRAHRAVAAYMRPGSQIMAPLSFIYNEIEAYSIQGLKLYDVLRSKGMISAEISPFVLAEQFGNAYVVLDDEYIARWQLTETSDFAHYTRIGEVFTPQKGRYFWIFALTH